MTYDKLNKKTF